MRRLQKGGRKVVLPVLLAVVAATAVSFFVGSLGSSVASLNSGAASAPDCRDLSVVGRLEEQTYGVTEVALCGNEVRQGDVVLRDVSFLSRGGGVTAVSHASSLRDNVRLLENGRLTQLPGLPETDSSYMPHVANNGDLVFVAQQRGRLALHALRAGARRTERLYRPEGDHALFLPQWEDPGSVVFMESIDRVGRSLELRRLGLSGAVSRVAGPFPGPGGFVRLRTGDFAVYFAGQSSGTSNQTVLINGRGVVKTVLPGVLPIAPTAEGFYAADDTGQIVEYIGTRRVGNWRSSSRFPPLQAIEGHL